MLRRRGSVLSRAHLAGAQGAPAPAPGHARRSRADGRRPGAVGPGRAGARAARPSAARRDARHGARPTPARWSATTSPGGLDTPEAYARYAAGVPERGYPAFKLHTWQPPLPGAPSVKRDLEACAAVREARRAGCAADARPVPLLLAPRGARAGAAASKQLASCGWKSRWTSTACRRTSGSANRPSLAICGPETAEGKMFSRAEWIKAGACDIVRAGVGDVGGLTPLMKIAPSGRVVRDADGSPRRRRRQPARPVRDAAQPSACTTSAACCTRSSTTTRRRPGSTRPSIRWTASGLVHVSQTARPGPGHQLELHSGQTGGR